MHKVPFAVAAVLTSVLAAQPAFAVQAPADSPAAQAGVSPSTAPKTEFGGPLVPGVCLLSRETLFAQSAVGKAAAARLKQLGESARAGLEADRRALEAAAAQDQRAAFAPPQMQLRQRQLQARAQALQAKAAQASRELEATRTKVTGRIEEAAQPVILAAYQAKGCGLLLSREAVLGGNLANDLTPAVVEGLDAKMTTITFGREHLAPAPTAEER